MERCRVADGRDPSRQGERTSTKLTAKRAASERVAAARAAEAKAVRRRNVLGAGAAVVVVLLLIGGIVFYGLTHKKKAVVGAGNPVVAASSTVTDGLKKAAADQTVITTLSAVSGPPSRLTGDPLTGADGKPQVLYIGAEYCPYCAITRWPLTVALSRFGTFSDLKTTKSAANDAAGPNTPTVSYRGSTYKSDYIDFVPVEAEDGLQQPLETPTDAQAKLWQSLGGSSFPFIDFGGKWLQKSSVSDPGVLAGMSPEDVASQIGNATTKAGSTVQQGAEVYTSIICGLDGGKPANVCTSAGVVAATTALSQIK
jgi:hypothetical protein